MPIRPENKHRYPKNWKEIRAQILERAGNRCEGVPGGPTCGVENHSTVRRPGPRKAIHRFVKIVLTIAHMDHTPENSEPGNLRALCQRCHNRYDMPMRIANRRETMKKKTAKKAPKEEPAKTEPVKDIRLEASLLVSDAASSAQKVILSKLDGWEGKDKWLIYGRVVSSLFIQHYQLTIGASQKVDDRMAAAPAEVKT